MTVLDIKEAEIINTGNSVVLRVKADAADLSPTLWLTFRAPMALAVGNSMKEAALAADKDLRG